MKSERAECGECVVLSPIDLPWGTSLSVSPRERSFESDFLGALRKIDLSGELSEAFNANFLQVLTLVQTQATPQNLPNGSSFAPQQGPGRNVLENGSLTGQNGAASASSDSVALYPLLTAQRANFSSDVQFSSTTQSQWSQTDSNGSASTDFSPQFSREMERSHSEENGEFRTDAIESMGTTPGNLEAPLNLDNANFENANADRDSFQERSDEPFVVPEENNGSTTEGADSSSDVRELFERSAVTDSMKTVRSEHQRALLQYRATIQSVAPTASHPDPHEVSSKPEVDRDVSAITGMESATELAELQTSFDFLSSQNSSKEDREQDGNDSTQVDGMTADVVDGMQTAHNAGPVETPQRPPRVQHGTLERVAELTARQASFVEEGGRQSFQIKLDPLGLGELMIDIQRDTDGKFEIRISAASHETHSLLQQQLDQMTQSLGQLGIPLSQFDVTHSGSGNGHGEFESEDQEQERIVETNVARPVRMADTQHSENTGINFRA